MGTSDPVAQLEVVETGVARITLDRSDRLNAYNRQMCRELLAGIDEYRARDDLRCLVITGAGRAFCVGGDVKGDPEIDTVLAAQMGHARELAEDMHAVNLALHRLDKPVVAAVNGLAVAGGLTLALMCDLRIAAESARLGDTSGRVGLLPDEGGAWAFPRVMGYDRALRMLLLGELYDAPTALELGLVTEVVADDRLETRSLELARAIAATAPITTRFVKRLLQRGMELSFESALGDAEMAVLYVNTTSDALEGKAAFREKRPPTFGGS